MTKKISQLPAATSVDTNDEFVINQDGTTKKLTTANQWDFANVNIDGGTIDGTAVNATTLTASGDVNFDSGQLFVDSVNNRVGVGVTNPSTKLTVAGPNNTLTFDRYSNGGQSAAIGPVDLGGRSALLFYVNTASSGAPSEQFRFGDGYLRLASGTNGIQFNGDTAAANTLDDYEEGTWTPTITASVSNPSVTYTLQVGYYTKIGRQVFVQGIISLSARTGGSGIARISGLPFTAANLTQNFNVGTAGQMTNFTSSLGDTDGQIIVVRSNANATHLHWFESNETTGEDWLISNIGASFEMRFSITYFTT